MLDWKDSYRTGNAQVDLDHQALFNITKVLALEIEAGNVDAVGSAIRGLIGYIERHFAREEELFLGTDYPNAERHLRIHRDITHTVKQIAQKYESDPQAIHSRELLDFLERWLGQHILKVDQDYVPYLAGNKPGKDKGKGLG